MSMFSPASFGADGGTPVYIVREWSPGVEAVQEIPGGYGVPCYTPVHEYSSGVRLVWLGGDGILAADRARMMMEQQAQAARYASLVEQQRSARPSASPGPSGSSAEVRLLLLG